MNLSMNQKQTHENGLVVTKERGWEKEGLAPYLLDSRWLRVGPWRAAGLGRYWVQSNSPR